ASLYPTQKLVPVPPGRFPAKARVEAQNRYTPTVHRRSSFICPTIVGKNSKVSEQRSSQCPSASCALRCPNFVQVTNPLLTSLLVNDNFFYQILTNSRWPPSWSGTVCDLD